MLKQSVGTIQILLPYVYIFESGSLAELGILKKEKILGVWVTSEAGRSFPEATEAFRSLAALYPLAFRTFVLVAKNIVIKIATIMSRH